MADNRQTEVTSPSPSPQCWGYESPSQLNREVSSILSRGPPPAEDERHKWTHPSPVHTSGRPVSCPLSAAGAGVRDKKFSSPLAVSAFQLTDQSQELRNHLYQAAYQHHSPFRFPFLPPTVSRYLPSLPPSPVRLPYPFPYPSSPAYPLPPELRDCDHPVVSNKRKYNEEPASTKVRAGAEWRDKPDQPPLSQAATSQSGATSGLRTTPANQPAAPHFRAGSLIQLANGNMKKVEHLKTEDFVNSAASCPDISLEEATVTKLENNNNNSVLITFSLGKSLAESVSLTITPEHPFFVTGRGWSSFSPQLTITRFSLDCKQLVLGDVCISLRHGGSEAGDRSHKQVRFQDSPLPPHHSPHQPFKRKRVSPSNPGTSSPFNINVKVTQVQVPLEERTFPSEKRKPLQPQKESV